MNAKNGIGERAIDCWRRVYCIVIPTIATILFFVGYRFGGVKIWESKNYADTLSSIITFVSIIISFFGVLLTLLISAKEKSELIRVFLNSADKKAFVAAIKRLIMFGLLTVIVVACLFLEDIMCERTIVVLLCVAVFSLIKFTTLTYRFTNILLLLFIRDKDDYKKKEGERLSPEKENELAERIKNGV